MIRDQKQMRMPGFDDLFTDQVSEYLCVKCDSWFTAEAGRRLYFCEACQPEQLGLFAAEAAK